VDALAPGRRVVEADLRADERWEVDLLDT